MPTKPVDTGLVLAMKTRRRAALRLGKIVVTVKVPMMNGGVRVERHSLPAISMHIAALRASGREVRRK